MNTKIFSYLLLITWLLTGEVLGQQNQNSALLEDYSCVTSLKYHLKKELLMDYFIKLALNETTCPISNCVVTIADVTEAAKLSQFPINVLAKATESLKLNGTRVYNAIINCNMTVNYTLYYLDLFETTFIEIYNNFVNSLNNPGETIPNVLKVVNVSSPDFMAAIAYGSDSTRLQILSTGNYSIDNIKTLLNITNKNTTEMLSFIPLKRVFKNLKKVNSTKLLIFVKDLGITSSSLNNFFKSLNVSLTEVLKYQNFANIVNDIHKFLNQEEALGVFVKKTAVIAIKKAKTFQTYLSNATEIVRNYSMLYLETVGNSSQVYHIKNVVLNLNHLSKDIVLFETTTPFTGKLFNASSTSNVTRLFNCTYVSKLVNGGLFVENFTDAHVDKHSLSVIKSKNTIYNLGSPIFCNKILYGLALEDYPKYINFTSFTSNATIKPVIPPVGENQTTTTIKPKPNSSNSLTCNLLVGLLTIGLYAFYW